MPLVDPQSRAVGYLILRHLYDGDIIEWPIEEDHPMRAVFADLEAQGFIARWDRIWPLHDRYRLTERGIAAIEAVYRPADAEAVYADLQRGNLRPVDRRTYLTSRGYDPTLWPLLHDPWTHWSTYPDTGARYHSYVWEDQAPFMRHRRSMIDPNAGYLDDRDDAAARQVPVGVIDLDHDAVPDHAGPDRGDFDVS